MATSPTSLRPNSTPVWRRVTVCLLTILGLIAATGYMSVHWVHRQILTTDNWVAVVRPLPKDDQVATALSTYTVDKLVTATDLEVKIQQALPDKASFLAAPLTDQIETRLQKRTKQVIQSDKFEAIWAEVNRRASERLLASARDETPANSGKLATVNVDLSSLKETVTNILDKRGITRPTNENNNVGVLVNLKTSLDTVKQYIQKIDFLNATLWLFAIACLLGALVLTYARRRLLLIMSSSVMVIALLQLIGVKAVRPYILDLIHQASYRPAIGVVYDTLVASFRNASISALLLGMIVFVLAFFLHRPFLQRIATVKGWYKTVPKTMVGRYYLLARQWVRQYKYQIMGVVTLAGLAVIAFAVDLTWNSGIRSALAIVIMIEIVNLVAARPQETPMKH